MKCLCFFIDNFVCSLNPNCLCLNYFNFKFLGEFLIFYFYLLFLMIGFLFTCLKLLLNFLLKCFLLSNFFSFFFDFLNDLSFMSDLYFLFMKVLWLFLSLLLLFEGFFLLSLLFLFCFFLPANIFQKLVNVKKFFFDFCFFDSFFLCRVINVYLIFSLCDLAHFEPIKIIILASSSF